MWIHWRGFVFFTVKCNCALNKKVPRSQIKVIMTSYWLWFFIVVYGILQQEMLTIHFWYFLKHNSKHSDCTYIAVGICALQVHWIWPLVHICHRILRILMLIIVIYPCILKMFLSLWTWIGFLGKRMCFFYVAFCLKALSESVRLLFRFSGIMALEKQSFQRYSTSGNRNDWPTLKINMQLQLPRIWVPFLILGLELVRWHQQIRSWMEIKWIQEDVPLRAVFKMIRCSRRKEYSRN